MGKTAFFLLETLEATSDWLSALLAPQFDAYHAALEEDPLVEVDEFVTFTNLPNETKDALEERAEWVRRCWRDGDKLAKWAEERRKRVNEEKRDERARKKAEAAERDREAVEQRHLGGGS